MNSVPTKISLFIIASLAAPLSIIASLFGIGVKLSVKSNFKAIGILITGIFSFVKSNG